jgi:hypothetical protein
MQAFAVAEHVDIFQGDRAAGRRDITGRAVRDTLVGSGEGAFLDRDVSGDVDVVDLDVRVREGAEPAGEEPGTGRLPSPVIPPGARKTTSSASTPVKPSMSWALNVSVPFSNASRTVIAIGFPFLQVM